MRNVKPFHTAGWMLYNQLASSVSVASLMLASAGPSAFGDVKVGSAAALFGSHLNVNAMRAYIDPTDGESKIVQVNEAGVAEGVRTNAQASLQYQEWMDIDRTVIEIATQRLVGIADLQGRGLTHPLGSIGVTVSLWDRSSDMTGAEIDMSGLTGSEEDTPNYLTAQVPVPVVHKDFRLNLRRLEASRRMGEGLDVTAAAIAGRVVAEASETMLFSGESIVVDGNTIYGYTTHPDRNAVDLTTHWDLIATANNYLIIADVIAMQNASRSDRHYGPWMLYIPTAYESKMDEDYRANDNRTVRDRIMALAGIQGVRVADFLPANNVVLVQLSRETVDLATAQDISTVQWTPDGGMTNKFKVMAVWVPRLKSDFDGRMGLVHLRPA
jgi:uncharacterized linocin/CFP29 family protein